MIVSDSFGRPWRNGIVDVAIGVSGLEPIEDLRGTPDHDGRTMRVTVRAVADEFASAAELTDVLRQLDNKLDGAIVRVEDEAPFDLAAGAIQSCKMAGFALVSYVPFPSGK